MNYLMRGRYKLFYSWAITRASLAAVADHIRETCVISSENRGLARNLRQELMDRLRAAIAGAALRRTESGDIGGSGPTAAASAQRESLSPTRTAGTMTRSKISLWFVAALAISAAADESRDSFEFPPETVASTFWPFRDTVRVRWDERYFYVESDGMPDHTMMVGIQSWNRQVPIPQSYRGANAFRFPLRPSFADKPVSGKETLFRGAIAIAANGVPIFNPIKQDGRTDTYLAGELDELGGHAGRADDYHYHVAPIHLQKRVGEELPLAWALDGFPILGYQEADGTTAQRLDWLNGHIHPGTSYHYHATRDYPRINGGFRGQVELRNGQVAVQPRAQGIRPSTRPLRGATIIGFVRSGDASFRLSFQRLGETHSIEYRLQPDGGARFVFVDGSGLRRVEEYPGRRIPSRVGNPQNRTDRRQRERTASGGRSQ